jgi:hypothetical protein
MEGSMSKAHLPEHRPEFFRPSLPTHPGDFSSSRMLDEYLAELEELLRREQWTAALREALALPHIAAALSDSRLQSSRERYENWCADWVHVGVSGESHISSDALYDRWSEQGQPEGFDSAPLHALTQLRLRRLVRPARVSGSWSAAGAEDESEVTDQAICAALLNATRRWYAYSGSRDVTVQTNLGRLAVLR